MKQPIDPAIDLAVARGPLKNLSKELLRLHKLLLDLTREDYEREHGRLESPFKLLNLALNDPFFAWLRKLSELIVLIDELTDRAITREDAEGVLAESRKLTQIETEESEYDRRFLELLRREVNVLMQQNGVRGAIAGVQQVLSA